MIPEIAIRLPPEHASPAELRAWIERHARIIGIFNEAMPEAYTLASDMRLTTGESHVFSILYFNLGRIVPRERIMEWLEERNPAKRGSDRSVDCFIKRARKKISGKFIIRTVYGAGYGMERVKNGG